jgi:NAD(P)-dependent dehydrogenase (short-subunit alcohol dehydrogenase family)
LTTAKKRRSRSRTQLEKARSAEKAAPAGGRLSGKIAVVTGGNRGIGLAIARALLGQGCSVVITGRDRLALQHAKTELLSIAAGRKPSSEVLAERCDVRKTDSVAAVFAAVKRRWGRLDILVNNAGISQPILTVEETPIELWKSVLEVNLTGMFLCTRAAVPLMSRGATIVNTISITAKTNVPKFAAYNASKHGAMGFTLTLREELISKGIRVMALIPGATDTEIWKQFWPDAPRDKMVKPESVAEAVLYAVLLPPEANLSELVLAPLEGVL